MLIIHWVNVAGLYWSLQMRCCQRLPLCQGTSLKPINYYHYWSMSWRIILQRKMRYLNYSVFVNDNLHRPSKHYALIWSYIGLKGSKGLQAVRCHDQQDMRSSKVTAQAHNHDWMKIESWSLQTPAYRAVILNCGFVFVNSGGSAFISIGGAPIYILD